MRSSSTLFSDLKKSLSPSGKLVSVDVTRENPDPNWSGSYDRAGLGKAADYVIMMGYDEYYEGRGEAGSVSSLPWVEEGLRLLLKDVPAHKVLLGVPFYTREWTVPAGDGKAMSKDVFMKDTDLWISRAWTNQKMGFSRPPKLRRIYRYGRTSSFVGGGSDINGCAMEPCEKIFTRRYIRMGHRARVGRYLERV